MVVLIAPRLEKMFENFRDMSSRKELTMAVMMEEGRLQFGGCDTACLFTYPKVAIR